ncbi:hypothetical protein GWK47_051723 [Chionoecetes opilio]|uniref:Uncharacterized protein n=1 Tax=Chionoecetes opilio TaxID=41210 RepID=A0A8J5CQI9_CHIOP|nr:hypothetical protein GWK47_051723 [Chionoecetes opilio]
MGWIPFPSTVWLKKLILTLKNARLFDINGGRPLIRPQSVGNSNGSGTTIWSYTNRSPRKTLCSSHTCQPVVFTTNADVTCTALTMLSVVSTTNRFTLPGPVRHTSLFICASGTAIITRIAIRSGILCSPTLVAFTSFQPAVEFT